MRLLIGARFFSLFSQTGVVTGCTPPRPRRSASAIPTLGGGGGGKGQRGCAHDIRREKKKKNRDGAIALGAILDRMDVFLARFWRGWMHFWREFGVGGTSGKKLKKEASFAREA